MLTNARKIAVQNPFWVHPRVGLPLKLLCWRTPRHLLLYYFYCFIIYNIYNTYYYFAVWTAYVKTRYFWTRNKHFIFDKWKQCLQQSEQRLPRTSWVSLPSVFPVFDLPAASDVPKNVSGMEMGIAHRDFPLEYELGIPVGPNHVLLRLPTPVLPYPCLPFPSVVHPAPVDPPKSFSQSTLPTRNPIVVAKLSSRSFEHLLRETPVQRKEIQYRPTPDTNEPLRLWSFGTKRQRKFLACPRNDSPP